jgi:hypothetical protein
MASREGKIPTTSVRLRISSLRRSQGIIAPHLAPDLPGERSERQDVLACLVEVGGGGRELRLQRGYDLAVLSTTRGAARVKTLTGGDRGSLLPRSVHRHERSRLAGGTCPSELRAGRARVRSYQPAQRAPGHQDRPAIWRALGGRTHPGAVQRRVGPTSDLEHELPRMVTDLRSSEITSVS